MSAFLCLRHGSSLWVDQGNFRQEVKQDMLQIECAWWHVKRRRKMKHKNKLFETQERQKGLRAINKVNRHVCWGTANAKLQGGFFRKMEYSTYESPSFVLYRLPSFHSLPLSQNTKIRNDFFLTMVNRRCRKEQWKKPDPKMLWLPRIFLYTQYWGNSRLVYR